MRAKLVNEAIKHLQPRDKEEIVKTIKEHTNDPYYQLYKAMINDIPELIEELLEKHTIVGSEEEDPFYTLASFYLTNEEVSFKTSGYYFFNENDELYCMEYEGERDEQCFEQKQFIEEHNIKCKLIRKGTVYSYVEFTGNAADIIKFVIQFLINYDGIRATTIIEQAYEIIFTG